MSNMAGRKRKSHKPKANVVGPAIRETRVARGRTLVDVAAQLDIDFGIKLDRSALGKIERCKRRISDIELIAIGSVLGVDIMSLLPEPAIEALTQMRRK